MKKTGEYNRMKKVIALSAVLTLGLLGAACPADGTNTGNGNKPATNAANTAKPADNTAKPADNTAKPMNKPEEKKDEKKDDKPANKPANKP